MSLPLGSDPPASARALIQQLADWIGGRSCGYGERLWVGVSGGLDSSLLLASAAGTGFPVTALHINHGLHDQSPAWEKHCEALAARFGVDYLCDRLTIVPGTNLEARAREARYRVFERRLGYGDRLLLAHHLNDNVEQFLFRLVRGSAPDELVGMPEERPLGQGTLLRPWLSIARADLEAVASDWGLDWIEDPSNQSLAHDRNFLRHEILPRLEQRWPSALGGLNQSRQAVAAVQSAVGEQADQALAKAVGPGGALRVSAVHALPDAIGKALLQRWLGAAGCRLRSGDQLRALHAQTASASQSGHLKFQVGGPTGPTLVRHFRGALYLVPGWLDASGLFQPVRLIPGRPHTIPGVGRVCLRGSEGTSGQFSGLQTQPIGLVPSILDADFLELSPRRPGQRAQPHGRAHSRDLKRLMPEWSVPPWWRSRVPFLYADGHCVAAAGLWAEQGWGAGRSNQSGAVACLEWLPGDY